MRYSVIVLLGLLFFSCRKDPKIEILDPTANCYCCEQIDAPDQIEFGNLEGMNIIYPDTTLLMNGTPYDPTINYKIDIDQDGINDLMFIREAIGSYWTGASLRTRVKVLETEMWLAVGEIPDTLYSYELVNYIGSNPVTQINTYHQNCTVHSSTYSIISYSYFLNYYQTGDVLSLSDNWSSDSITIDDYENDYPHSEDYTNPDTTIFYHNSYNNSCHDIAFTNTPSYIGIKKYSCGEEKLGWIKLSIGYYMPASQLLNGLRIYEIALQK